MAWLGFTATNKGRLPPIQPNPTRAHWIHAASDPAGMDPPEWNAPRLTPFLSAPRAKLLRPVPPVKPAGRRSNPPERNAVPPSPPTPSRRLERRSTPPLGLRGPTNRRAVRPFPLPLLPPRRRSARPEPGSFASTGAIGSIRRPLSPLATADEKTVMACGKQLPRGQRDLPSDRPAHTRTTRPIEICEVTADGIVMASEVPFYEVMPKACTKRQLKWRRRIQKLGTYGNATIVYPLTEIEQELLNAMGALAVQQFED